MERRTTSRRTVLILTGEPPGQLGGSEHFIRMLTGCLTKSDYNVEVIHRDNCGIPWRRRSKRRYIAYAQDLLLGYFVGRRAGMLIRENAKSIAAVISSGPMGWYPLPEGPAKVHVYHGTSVGVAETSREHVSRLGYLKMKYWDGMLFEQLCGRDKIRVAVSNQVQEEVQRVFGYSTYLIWLPLDMGAFYPSDDRAVWRTRWGIPQDRVVGIFVGNSMPYKGFHVLIQLIQMIPRIFWIVVIRGNHRSELEDLPHVKLLSEVPHDQMPGLYACADFALTPYRLGPFSYALAEALACGVPVIASPARTSPEFLRHTVLRKLLVDDQDDLEGFSRAINDVIEDPGVFRQSVLELRPTLETLLSLQCWRAKFTSLLDL